MRTVLTVDGSKIVRAMVSHHLARYACRIIEAADREVKKGLLYGYAFPMTDRLVKAFIHERAADRDRDEIRRIQSRFQAAFERLREAYRKASPRGRSHVEFWMRRTQFAVEWLDMAIACADLGKMLGDGLKPGTLLTPQQKQSALASLDGLLDRSRSLIEMIAGDAKHIGDLGQIANMNQHVHRYLKKKRSELESRASKPL